MSEIERLEIAETMNREIPLKYEIVSSRVTVEETCVDTYGIKSPDGRVILDVSPDRNAVLKLVSSFNENGLDPIHLDDVIEDFFS